MYKDQFTCPSARLSWRSDPGRRASAVNANDREEELRELKEARIQDKMAGLPRRIIKVINSHCKQHNVWLFFVVLAEGLHGQGELPALGCSAWLTVLCANVSIQLAAASLIK